MTRLPHASAIKEPSSCAYGNGKGWDNCAQSFRLDEPMLTHLAEGAPFKIKCFWNASLRQQSDNRSWHRPLVTVK
jgi:hypothetical protein